MNRFNTTFSERSHYRSFFASNRLRLLAFVFWQSVLLALLSGLIWGGTALALEFIPSLAGVSPFLGAWQVPVVLLALYTLVCLAWPLAFGKPHWHKGPQNHRIPQVRAERLSRSVLVCAGLVAIVMFGFLGAQRIAPNAILAIKTAIAAGTALVATVGLVLLALLAGVKPFLSKQSAIWRHFWRPIREDRIRNDYAPFGDLAHRFNNLVRWAGNYFSLHNHYALLLFSCLVGGILIPAWQVLGDSERNFASVRLNPLRLQPTLLSVPYDIFLIFEKFIPESITYIGLIFGILLGYSLFRRRQRYVFSPFIVEDQQQAEPKTQGERRDREHLRSAAYHLTQQFIDQLEQIGTLLTTRQIENLQSPKRLPLTEFITSGEENDFLAAIQSLVDLEERPKNLAGRLLASLVKTLAVITITGTLRRRDQTTVELEVRLSQRFGNQTSIIVPIVSSHGTEELFDDATAATVARTAALRLLVKAGAVSHLASSEESLDAFLEGLAASAAHNWWRASVAYQNAIHREEAVRGSFGLGRYHLALALLRKGELDAGFQNLIQAERAGKPMAEIHYMLAVVLLHKYWSELDERETDFQQIVRYAHLAMRNQRIFPEAAHLVGAAYYHRGKLLDRSATRTYARDGGRSLATTMPVTARNAYDKAAAQFQKAVRQYDRRVYRLQKAGVPNPILIGELERLRRDRMTATHQLADALRSAGCYALAETYYEDVLAAYPDNRRTLIDLAKTFVLAKNWQRADEFLSREVLIFPEGKWSADINLYLAWTYAGGINEQLRANTSAVKRGFLALAHWATTRLGPAIGQDRAEEEPHPKEAHLLLGRAMGHLDYALHQRARFIACWRQTNWQAEFGRAFKLLGTPDADFTGKLKALYKAPIRPPGESRAAVIEYVDFLRAWLVWRIHQNAPGALGTFNAQFPYPLPEPKDASAALTYPQPEFEPRYQEWMSLREEFVQLLKDIESTGRMHGIVHARRRLELAALALDNWKLTSALMNEQRKASLPHLSFAERWVQDIYAEIALLAVRLLAEAHAYEVAWIVAICSEHVVTLCMEKAIECWTPDKGDTKPHDNFKFTPYIARYQLATLHAWKAWCADRLEQTDAARARLVVGKDRYLGIQGELFEHVHQVIGLAERFETSGTAGQVPPLGDGSNRSAFERARLLLKEARRQLDDDVELALQQAPRHPLALWVQAQRTRAALQADQAASELQRMLEVLGPYDPNQSIANWHLIERKQPRVPRRPTRDEQQSAVGNPQQTPGSAQPAGAGAARERVAANQQHLDTSHRLIRQRLGTYELVSGRRQFSSIVNVYATNEQLAAVFADAGEYNLSIQHLMLALTQSPYWDIGADNLQLVLIQYLDKMDRLRDAYAVSSALRASRQALEANSLSIAKLHWPYLWECIILTRMRRYEASLVAGEELQRRLDDVFANFDKDGQTMYSRRLQLADDKDQLTPLFKHVWEMFTDQEQGSPFSALRRQTNHEQGKTKRGKLPAPLPLRFQHFLAWLTELAEALPVLSADEASEDKLARLLSLEVVHAAHKEKVFLPTMSEQDHAEHEYALGLYPKLDINRNIALLFLDFLGEEAIALIELQAQLWNNRAYNTIELRLHLSPREAIAALEDKDREKHPLVLVDQAIDALQELLTYNLLSASQRLRLRRELALYLDTKAWFYYRLGRLASSRAETTEALLDNAEQHIQKALDNDKGSTVIYYHAARIHLMRLERLWQRKVWRGLPPAEDTDALTGTSLRSADSFDNHLVAVHHYWTQARVHDHRGRFRAELAWIGQRLAEYREQWKTLVRDGNGNE